MTDTSLISEEKLLLNELTIFQNFLHNIQENQQLPLGFEAIFESSEKIAGIVNYLQNDTERLSKKDAFFEKINNQLTEIIIRFDAKNCCTYANMALYNEFGIDPQQAYGIQSSSFFPDENLNQLLGNRIRETFLSGIKSKFEYGYPSSGKFFLLTLVPQKDDFSPSIENVIVSIVDITSIKERELASLAKHREMCQITEYLDNFIYAAAHDIKTPVANLKLLLALIRRTEYLEEKLVYANKIEQVVQRMDKSLNGFIQAIDIQYSNDVEVKKISFASLYERTSVYFKKNETEEKQIQITVDFEDAPEIYYIEKYLVNIFKSLLCNAIKYSDNNRPCKIHISTLIENGFIVLRVEDNGIGIDLAKFGRNMFKPFIRFSAKTDGKGLGLHLIMRMVQKNGGNVTVESELGKGTVLKCYLKAYPENSI